MQVAADRRKSKKATVGYYSFYGYYDKLNKGTYLLRKTNANGG